jgi:hypothetical protein
MENRRRYPRYEIEVEARIYSADLNLSATVVDISDGGIGIISKEPIKTESAVFISLFPISKDPIMGTPVWSFFVEKDQNYYYRISIETENLALDRMEAYGFPERSKLISDIISEIKKTGGKVKEV